MAGRFPGAIPKLDRPWSIGLGSELHAFLRRMSGGMAQLQTTETTFGGGGSGGVEANEITSANALLIAWMAL